MASVKKWSIEIDGVTKSINDLKSLNKETKAAKESVSDFGKTTADFAKMANKSFQSVENQLDNLSDSLDKGGESLHKISNEIVRGFAENLKTINFESIESLDTFLDKTVEVRDKAINMANAVASLAEGFGPYGRAASFALQLVAPLIGDLAEKLEKGGSNAEYYASKLAKATSAEKNAALESKKSVEIRSKSQDLLAKNIEETADKLLELDVQLESNAKNIATATSEEKLLASMTDKLAESNAKAAVAAYKFGEATASELFQLQALAGAVNAANSSNEDRLSALEAFDATYDTYLSKIKDEIELQIELNKAYEENIIKLTEKEVAAKFASTNELMAQQMLAAAESLLQIRQEVEKLDTQAQYRGGLIESEQARYNALKIKETELEAAILDKKNAANDAAAQQKKQVVEISKVLGATVTLTADGERLTNENASKKAAAAKAAYDAAEKEVNLYQKFYEDRQAAEQLYQSLAADGRLASAEAAIKERRRLFELQMMEAKTAGLAAENAGKAAEAAIKRVNDAKMAELSSLEDILAAISEGSLGVFDGLDGAADEIEGLPEKFKAAADRVSLFLSDLGEDATQEIVKQAYEKFKTEDGQLFDFQGFATELAKKNVESSILFLEKYISVEYDEAIAQNRAALIKAEKERQKGAIDVQKEREAFDKKEAEDLAALRLQAQERANNTYTKGVVNLESQIGNKLAELGLPSIQSFQNAAKRETEAAIDAIFESAKSNLSKYNAILDKEFVFFDGKNVILKGEKELLESGKLTQTELENLQKTVENFNAVIGIEVEKGLRDLAQSGKEYAEIALKAFQDLEARNTADLSTTLKINQLAYDQAYDLALQKKDAFVESGGNLSKKEISELRKTGRVFINELEKQKNAELEIEVQRFENQLVIIKENGGDVVELERQLYLKRLEIQDSYTQKSRQIMNDFFVSAAEVDFVELATSGVETLAGLAGDIGTYLDGVAQARIDAISEQITQIDGLISAQAGRISALEADLTGKISGRRDAILAALEAEKAKEIELAATRQRLENERVAAEKKAAKQRKAFAISDAIINGAVAITQIFANKSLLPSPADYIVKAANAVAVGASTALQVASISSQKYAEGGFTGQGGSRDETGQRVAGVVHEGEWVAPKWLVNSPKFSATIQELENQRVRGFATGGKTSSEVPQAASNSINSENKLLSQLIAYTDAAMALSNRPVIVDVKEFSNVSSGFARKVNANTL